MQLKRDTDYALRVLFCLKETILMDAEGPQKSLSVSQIATHIGGMRTTAQRICERLAQAELIRSSSADDMGEKTYYATPDMLTRSMLDVVEAIEGTGKVFAVFDRRSLLYKTCGKKFDRVQKKYEQCLASTPLTSLIGKMRRTM